ncbi:hypothetical protein GCM10020219_088880 [Nonomuraea dietziae]
MRITGPPQGWGATQAARQAIGAWPAELYARRIVDGLLAAAENEPDQEKRNKLKETATFLATTGWSVLPGVAGNATSTGIGL